MKLSDRLEMVLSFVNKTEAAADIGTDHGHVPVELVRRGVAGRAYAMDVRKGPLGKARENVLAAGLGDKIELRLSDGMEKLAPQEAGTVIIAGMGGELMIHILERGRHTWEGTSQWVLSPHSELPKLRRWLWEQGFSIVKEAMVYEDGKYYTVLDVRRDGQSRESQKAEREFRYGACLLRARDPVFYRYLRDEEQKLAALQKELKERAQTSERARESLAEVEEKLAYNREVQHEMQRDC